MPQLSQATLRPKNRVQYIIVCTTLRIKMPVPLLAGLSCVVVKNFDQVRESCHFCSCQVLAANHKKMCFLLV